MIDREGLDAHAAAMECKGDHVWHRPTEDMVRCLICGLSADEFILGLRADEATGDKQP